jgi:hypothetical protein
MVIESELQHEVRVEAAARIARLEVGEGFGSETDPVSSFATESCLVASHDHF